MARNTFDDAVIQDWIKQLHLHLQNLDADLQYAYATHYCSDCPGVDDNNGELGRVECCRETGEFDEQYEGDIAHLHRVKVAIDALRAIKTESE